MYRFEIGVEYFAVLSAQGVSLAHQDVCGRVIDIAALMSQRIGDDGFAVRVIFERRDQLAVPVVLAGHLAGTGLFVDCNCSGISLMNFNIVKNTKGSDNKTDGA